jgi:hypothetical protein
MSEYSVDHCWVFDAGDDVEPVSGYSDISIAASDFAIHKPCVSFA